MNFRFFPMTQHMNYRSLFLGLDAHIPIGIGGSGIEINFDNGATTLPLASVLEEINAVAPMYGSIHRGVGYKSVVSSQIYEQARTEVLKFVGGDSRNDVVIFVKNTTEALNKLANRFVNKNKKEVILSTWMEHHSNLLPWRDKFHVDYIEIDDQGHLRMDDLLYKLERYQGAVKLVTVTGASNVTGHRNPIHKIAELAHRYGAKICVDGAQLVPHAPVDMRSSSSLEHIDFLAFSAHKMYAPFGTGVLIGPRTFFEQGAPDYQGGGTAQMVTPDRVLWYDPPGKEEAGTPNLMGVVALVAAIRTLSAVGMKKVLKYEENMLRYAYEQLRWMEGITFYGGIPLNNQQFSQRIGVISFNVEGLFHEDVAKYLAKEGGIAVRNGCFCAQPYVQRLLQISKQEMAHHMANPSLPHPGMVRVSLALYNTKEEIDIFLNVLSKLANNRPRNLRTLRTGSQQ